MKPAMPNIAYQNVQLRALTSDDLPMTLAWRNHDRARVWFKSPQPLTHIEHRAWFDRYAQNDDEFMFIIETKMTGKAVGQIGLYGMDTRKREAEIGRVQLG